MNGFNKQNLKTLRADIDAALNAVAAKHGLSKLAIGNISFTETTFRTTLNAECSAADGSTAAQARWNEMCGLEGFSNGLRPEHFGITFKDHKGLDHTICDVQVKRGGNVVVVTSVDGMQKKFAWPAQMAFIYIQRSQGVPVTDIIRQVNPPGAI